MEQEYNDRQMEKTWADEALKLPQAPAAPGPAFFATRREMLAAVIVYIAAYCYFCPRPTWLTVFCALYVAAGELLYWHTRRSGESFVWLGCMALLCISDLLGRNQVWGEYSALFLHVFGVYWLLSRSGRLCMGRSSTLLPLDALHGFFVFPFKHFFLRIRTVWYALTHLRRGERKKAQPATAAATVLVSLLAFVLLLGAGRLLLQADEGFARLFERFRLELHVDAAVCLRLLLSLPVGAYVFGLLAGAGREREETIRARGESVSAAVARLRRVPGGVWTAALAVFLALYLVFFCVQGSYLFGAFRRQLPAGFTVANYARQGFFELCGVMTLNFMLLWLVTRTAGEQARQGRLLQGLCTALLAESMLLAVIAFSKLMLYISCFGFTPKRLQSSWLVCVLFFGCGASVYSLWTGKRSFRAWMFFGAVTLAALSVY